MAGSDAIKMEQLRHLLSVIPLMYMAEMNQICLATASGCIRFTLATASDQNCCTNTYIRSRYFKLPLTLATASDHIVVYS